LLSAFNWNRLFSLINAPIAALNIAHHCTCV
jgi:hypothetical protein